MDFGLRDSIIRKKKEGLNPIVAEIKVYSPKHGDLLRGRDPLRILEIYEKCGVAGISYITAPEFRGDFNLLREICRATELPVLRKDFIKDKGEIERTAEAEASAILLIARLLKDRLADFVDHALEHGLEPLVEVHSVEDISTAVKTSTPLIGINNRDISRLETDDGTVELTKRLSPLIPERFIKVSESGIVTLRDLKIALRYADAALIGTAFMKAEDTESIVKRFVG